LVFWLLTIDTGFNLVGELQKRGGGNKGEPVTVVELGWRLVFGFEMKFAWKCVGEVLSRLYRGVGGVQND
jgi:hypothetical protein